MPASPTVDDPWSVPPTLHGRHVTLRPIAAGDAPGLALAHDDPETLRYFPFGIDSEAPSARTVAHVLASGRQALVQIDADGRIVGSTSMYNMSALHRRVTVGYTWLSARVRGTPINTEAKLLLLQHIFDVLGARRTEFTVDDRNARSRAAVLAIGAHEEGALRMHARRRDGTWRTTIVYSVTDTDWPAVRERLLDRLSRPA